MLTTIADKALLPTKPLDSPIEASAAAVIRRRSLATPGLATRHSIKFKEQKQPIIEAVEKAEDAEKEIDRLWKPEMSKQSPLAELSGMPPAVERPHTPQEMDYGQLSRTQTGPLMVTNGMDSPASSTVVSPPKALRPPTSNPNYSGELPLRSENSSAGKFRVSDETEAAMLAMALPSSEKIGSSSRSRKSAPPPQARMVNIPARLKNYSLPKRNSVAVSQVEQPETAADRSERSILDDSSERSSHEESDVSTIQEQKSLSGAAPAAGRYAAEASASTYNRLPQMPRRPAPPPPPPKMQSAGSEQELDEGYFDASPDVEDQRQAILKALETTPTKPIQVEEITPETALRSHPPPKIQTMSSLKSRRASQVKNDSGYSSSGASVHADDANDTYELDDTEITPTGPRHSQRIESNLITRSRSEDRRSTLLHRKLTDEVVVPDPPRERIQLDPPNRPKVGRSKSWRQSVRKTLPLLWPGESEVSVADTSASKSSAGSRPGGRKLQKRPPSVRYTLNLGQAGEPGGVPRVPSEVFSRFVGRDGDAPESAYTDRSDAYSTAQPSAQPSRDPSAEYDANVFRSHYDYADSEDERSTKRKSRLSRSDSAPAPMPLWSFSRSSSRTRLKKKRKDDEEPTPSLSTGFAEVAQQLGASPYDAAGSQTPQSSGQKTHPFQLGSHQLRAGPMAGMDDQAASQFARMKSQQRAAMREAMETDGQHLHPGMPSRPNSYQDQPMQASPNRGRSGFFPRRPRSMHGDSPDRSSWLPRLRPRSIGPSDGRRRHAFSFAEHDDEPLPQLIRPELLHTHQQSSYGSANLRAGPDPAEPHSNYSSRPSSAVTENLDWATPAKGWRQRKLQAQTNRQSTRPAAPTAKSTPIIPRITNPFFRRSHTTPVEPPAGPHDRHRAIAPPAANLADDGLYGRYGGGLRYSGLGLAGKRDVSIGTMTMRRSMGVDLGDLPSGH